MITLDESIVNNEKFISTENIFKILKKLHGNSYAAQKKFYPFNKSGLYVESIYSFEKLYNEVQSLDSKSGLSRQEYEQASLTGDRKVIDKIIERANNLRFYAEPIEQSRNNYVLCPLLETFIKITSKTNSPFLLDKSSEKWNRNKFPWDDVFTLLEEYVTTYNVMKKSEPNIIANTSNNNENFDKAEAQSNPKYIPYNQANASTWLNPHNGNIVDIHKDWSQGIVAFDRIINEHRQVYSMFLDIEISWITVPSSQHNELLDIIYPQVLMFLYDKVYKKIKLIAHYLGFELGAGNSIRFFCVPIFDKDTRPDNRVFVALIEQKLNLVIADILKYSPSFHGSATVDVKVTDLTLMFKELTNSQKILGHLSNRNLKQIRKFKYWIISFLYFKNTIIRFDNSILADLTNLPEINFKEHIVVQETFRKNRFLKNLEYIGHPIKNKELMKPINPKRIDLNIIKNINEIAKKTKLEHTQKKSINQCLAVIRNDKKRIWSCKDLAEDSQAYLNVMDIIYREEMKLSKKNNGDLLLMIERFLLLINSVSTDAFIVSSTERREATLNVLLTKLTVQAKQLLFLLSELNNLLLDGQQFPPPYTTWQEQDFDLNNALSFFSDFKEFKDLDVNRLINGFDRIISCHRLDKEVNPFTYKIMDFKRSVKPALVSANLYLNSILKKNSVISRFKLSISTENQTSDKLILFRVLVGDFIKNIKRTKNIVNSQLLGYIGTYHREALTADIVLIFEDSDTFDPDTVLEKIVAHWTKYIKIKQGNANKRKERLSPSKEQELASAQNITEPLNSKTSDLIFSAFNQSCLIAESIAVFASEENFSHKVLRLPARDHLTKKFLVSTLSNYFAGYRLYGRTEKLKNLPSFQLFIKGELKPNKDAKKPNNSASQKQGTTPNDKVQPSMVIEDTHNNKA